MLNLALVMCLAAQILPDLPCILMLLPAALEAAQNLHRLKSRPSERWPAHLSHTEIDFEHESQFQSSFLTTYRVRPRHFRELSHRLKLPATMKTEQRDKFSGETGLFCLLARLGSKSSLYSIGVIIRMNPRRIGRICNRMVEWLFMTWGHVVKGPAKEDRLGAYTEAILDAAGLFHNTVFGFIDCTIRAVARPVYGQRALYTGWKKKHGLKYQAVMVPDGLIVWLFGPRTCRRFDTTMLTESGLLEEIEAIQERLGVDVCLYGDPAYRCGPAMQTGFNSAQREDDPTKDQYSRSMNSMRTAVEWGFGIVIIKFPWVDNKSANKVGKIPVGLYYHAAVLLTNCITCVEGGNQISTFFDLQPPLLEEYLV